METAVQIVLGVPGPWPTRSDIVKEIAGHSGGLIFVGNHLFNPATSEMFEVDVYQPDPQLRRAFALAGSRSLSEDDLNSIVSHAHALYVIGRGGSAEAARSMMEVACGLLKAGGMAVKVESAGVAHSAKDWLALTQDNRLVALYRAYVTLIGGNGVYYSCGMHCLGLRDAIVSGDMSSDEAARLLQGFLLYTLVEQPELHSGETFSLDAQSPHFRLTEEVSDIYQPGDLFYNPFGMWRLWPA